MQMCAVHSTDTGQGTASHSSECNKETSGSTKGKTLLGQLRCYQESPYGVTHKVTTGLAWLLDGSNKVTAGISVRNAVNCFKT
jgi:hypothetical protein